MIISAERSSNGGDQARSRPATTIPYHVVDAVVHLPFGAYRASARPLPSDNGHVIEVVGATMRGSSRSTSISSVRGREPHEFMDKLVGYQRIRRSQGGQRLKDIRRERPRGRAAHALLQCLANSRCWLRWKA